MFKSLYSLNFSRSCRSSSSFLSKISLCSVGKEDLSATKLSRRFLLSSPRLQTQAREVSLTTYAFQHAPVQPTEAGAAGQDLLPHRVEVEGLAGLLDVLDVDDPAAVGPADEHVELG